MGKAEDEQPLPLNVDSAISPYEADADRNRCPRRISKFIRFRCVIALVLGASVLLSAIFWLKPLFRPRDQVDLDLAALLKAHDIVASFKLQKPVSELNAYIPQLELDIFEEMAILNSTVEVLSLVPSAASNMTIVVFSVVPITKNSNISSASLSVLKSDFVSFVLHQSSLRLSPSLFGDPFAFEVLKLKGGITVVPPQSAYLLQKVQTLFDFSLNFSIYQILDSFDELKNQLKSGLRLSSFEFADILLGRLTELCMCKHVFSPGVCLLQGVELGDSNLASLLVDYGKFVNLYVSLSNSYGSTVAPPTTIKASVLLAVRNRPPSMPRLKQLAQTITGSPAKNLGLNHSEFGKVKQVRLSSVLQHSLNSSNDNGKSPSPAPLPHVDHHRHHHHHHHHHHRHHRDTDLAPSPSVEKGHGAKPPLPSGCRGLTGKVKRHAPLAPAVAPVVKLHLLSFNCCFFSEEVFDTPSLSVAHHDQASLCHCISYRILSICCYQ
ncbi:hypothetical protein Syun_002704 [Stephania yunnanensis]|uniref:DUF7036 domain-containing protein n=1 Tax=Stephania yunnanensis TaxID=152371 RepID=A0AAP0LK65_9MAGN